MIKLVLLSILIILLNIPFGYWRANVKRFSLQWFLAIHIPVVFIIFIRFASGVGFAWYTYLFFVSAYVLGQQSGFFVLKMVKRRCSGFSSCMVMDLIKCKPAG